MATTVELRNVADNREHSLQVDVDIATVETLLECVRNHWKVPRARLVLGGALLNNPSQTLREAGLADTGKVVVFVAPVRAPPAAATPTSTPVEADTINANHAASNTAGTISDVGVYGRDENTNSGWTGGSRLGGICNDDIDLDVMDNNESAQHFGGSDSDDVITGIRQRRGDVRRREDGETDGTVHYSTDLPDDNHAVGGGSEGEREGGQNHSTQIGGARVDGQVPCRICFSTDSSEQGNDRMISPCLCRGSMGRVHVGCLNEWRATSANSRSYYVCEQCGYRYNIRRTWLSDMLQKDNSVSVACLMLIVVLVVLLGFVTSAFGVQDHFYEFIEFYPPWRQNRWYFGERYEWLYIILVEYMSSILDHVVGGGLVLGIGSFLVYKYHDLQEAHQMNDYHSLFFFIGTLASGNNRMWRAFAVAGIGYAYIIMYTRVSVHAKRIMQYAGAAVLEVRNNNNVAE